MTDNITLPRSVLDQALAITTHWLELDKRNHCDLLTVSEYKLITGAVENLRAALEQPQVEQEPVAWMYVNDEGECEDIGYGATYLAGHEGCTPLYTYPQPPRQPLTEMEIVELRQLTPGTLDVQFVLFARAIERAHGIGGEA